MDPLLSLEKEFAPGGIARWANELRKNILSTLGADALDEKSIAAMMLAQRFGPKSVFPPTEREMLIWETNFSVINDIFDTCHCVAFAELCDDVHDPYRQKGLYEHYAHMLNDILFDLGYSGRAHEYVYSIQLPFNNGRS